MRLLLLSGSFHSKSKSLLISGFVKNHLVEHECEISQLDALPFYSEDLNLEKPANAAAFLRSVEICDGIICITPEYNHSIPAVLKNAIDWASRPAFKSPLKGKPVTFISQAEGPVGGARVQAHLKLVLDSTLSIIFPSHEMMITSVSKVVSENGDITDIDTKRRILRHLDEFLVFTKRFTFSG